MPTYTIKDNQNLMDVVEQLYTNDDNIGQLYLDNEDIDINTMQKGLEVEFTSPTNQTRNDIVNNDYEFINGNEIVYTEFLRIGISSTLKYKIPTLLPDFINLVGTGNGSPIKIEIEETGDIFFYNDSTVIITTLPIIPKLNNFHIILSIENIDYLFNTSELNFSGTNIGYGSYINGSSEYSITSIEILSTINMYYFPVVYVNRNLTLTDFSFISNISNSHVGAPYGWNIYFYMHGSLTTSAKMESFLQACVDSEITNAYVYSETSSISTSSNKAGAYLNYDPTGFTNYTTLVSRGWSFIL